MNLLRFASMALRQTRLPLVRGREQGDAAIHRGERRTRLAKADVSSANSLVTGT